MAAFQADVTGSRPVERSTETAWLETLSKGDLMRLVIERNVLIDQFRHAADHATAAREGSEHDLSAAVSLMTDDQRRQLRSRVWTVYGKWLCDPIGPNPKQTRALPAVVGGGRLAEEPSVAG